MKPVADLIAKAIYSGIVSNKIAEALGEKNREEIFVCSVFHRFGEFLAAYYMPADYNKTLNLMDGHPEIYRVSKTEFRGVGFTIAREWRFPSKVVACMERFHSEDIEAAGLSEIEMLKLISTISNDIAEIMNGPEGTTEKKQEMERLLCSFRGKFSGLAKSAATIIKQSTADMEVYCAAYGIKLEDSDLGQRLLGDRALESKRAAVEEAWRSFSVEDTFTDAEESVEMIFAKGMQDVTQAISENFSIEDVFRIILETIYRGFHRLGARRTVFFMKDVKEPKFTARLALGQLVKVGLTMAIDGKNDDIIGILLKEQKDLFVLNTMSEKAAPLIPDSFRSISPEPSFPAFAPHNGEPGESRIHHDRGSRRPGEKRIETSLE